MIQPAASRWLAELRSQWVGNSRLRWGLLVIAGILWAQGLLMLGDAAQAWREQASSVRDEIDRVRPLMRDKVWPGRADDARQQLDAVRSMLWQASDIGLAEAAVQDWVRAAAGKAGLSIRELAVSRPPVAAAAATTASGPVATGMQPVRVRLVVDLNRLPLMGLLAELARNEQVIVVDRLVLRPAALPPLAEIELRALVALRAEAR
jgi:Type II secretion system (T2SS), protein M subtype b